MTTNHKDLILKKLLNEDKGNEKILFEQYKLYVKMADEVSNRRNDMNKFYVILSTSLISILQIIASITHEISTGVSVIIIAIFIIFIFINYLWIINIKSYSTLNCGKFDVINEIENKLPAKGFTIEWELLTEVYQYNELTNVEKNIPIIMIGMGVIILIINIIMFHLKII